MPELGVMPMPKRRTVDDDDDDEDEDENEDPPRCETERGILCGGSYRPPPMFTPEQVKELGRRQDEQVAAAGIALLNERRASQGLPRRDLEMPLKSMWFRSKQGLMHHGIFLAKPSDDPKAEARLFFAECKSIPGDILCQAVDCFDLGPITADPGCRYCEGQNSTPPNYHPCDITVDHCCRLCDGFQYHWDTPIFHPSGYRTNHLCFPVMYDFGCRLIYSA